MIAWHQPCYVASCTTKFRGRATGNIRTRKSNSGLHRSSKQLIELNNMRVGVGLKPRRQCGGAAFSPRDVAGGLVDVAADHRRKCLASLQLVCLRPLRMTRWAVGDFHVKRFAWFEYFVGCVVALLAAHMPDTFGMCVVQYGVMGGFFVVVLIVILVVRPFRSHWANGGAAFRQALLAATMMCATTLISEPFGPGADAANAVRWVMTFLTGLRGVIGLAILYVEHRLIETHVKEIAKERARRKRSSKISNILDDDDDTAVDLAKAGNGATVNYFSEVTTGGAGSAMLGGVSDKDLMAAPLLTSAGADGTRPETGKARASALLTGILTPPNQDRAASWGVGGSPRGPTSPTRGRATAAPAASPGSGASLSVLLAPSGSTIFTTQANELERRQALAAMIRGDVHPAAGHVTRGEGGAATLPSWL